MRGRLINKFYAQFALLDPSSTTYDPDYGEPIGDRAETLLTVPCQIEEASWFRQTFSYTGLDQEGEISLILHFRDLETLGLVNAVGAPLITIQTRLVKTTRQNGVLVREYPNPPGMYVTQIRDSSNGLQMRGNAHRNLCFLLLAPRKSTQ